MPETGVFLPTLYRLVGRNQLQRPAALFIGQNGEVAERLLAAGTVAEYRQELVNWGMTTTSLNANRMVLQRILFLLMQNLMLEEEKLGSQCAVPSRFKGNTSETCIRSTLTHSIVVLNAGTIWDLKEELQLWGLLHEHLNSGRIILCILLRFSLRNLELSKLPDNDQRSSTAEPAPLAVSTPPKHQADSPATVPAAKRMCVDISGDSLVVSSNSALSQSISPVLLCAALQCASQLSSSQNDDVASACTQSHSTCASTSSTQPACDDNQIDLKAAQSHSECNNTSCLPIEPTASGIAAVRVATAV
jgi:hypothetical protein